MMGSGALTDSTVLSCLAGLQPVWLPQRTRYVYITVLFSVTQHLKYCILERINMILVQTTSHTWGWRSGRPDVYQILDVWRVIESHLFQSWPSNVSWINSNSQIKSVCKSAPSKPPKCGSHLWVLGPEHTQVDSAKTCLPGWTFC